ncbi:MAG: hypothetical protein H0T51_04690, partial [Pirellulales bacterium]|nr:hypothetical protein [Pirellulales bacterium]
TVTSALAPYPDLVVADVSIPSTALPGQSITVNWTPSNPGAGSATGNWVDQLYLSDDAVIGNDIFLGSFASTGAIASGGTSLRQAQVSIPSFVEGDFHVIVLTNVGGNLYEVNVGNNAKITAQTIHIAGTLQLALSRAAAPENSVDPAVVATLTRTGSTAANLVVAVSSSNLMALSVPVSVTIPAGQSSVQFDLATLDNVFADGDRPVTITASAPGFVSGVAACTVQDNDLAGLTVVIATNSFVENAANPVATAVVTRNTSTTLPLAVQLLSDNINKVTVPATVTIPAGQTSATFSLTAVNNTVLDGTARVTITASAAGLATGSDRVDVHDDDAVNLSLSFASSTIVEGAISPATIGTVTRAVVTSAPLVVTLSSANTSAISMPAQVTIPANRSSVSFTVNAPDDTFVNGAQSVLISARLTTTSGVVLDAGAAAASLQVLDNDGPTLTVTSPTSALREGATGVGIVSRNTDPSAPLVVTLASSDTTGLTVPATVTIPAGEASATFVIQAKLDGIADGIQSAVVTASASGFNSGSVPLVTTDSDLPDLQVTSVSAPTTVRTGQTIEVSWTVINTGVVPATGSWVDRLYLSLDDQLADDVVLGTERFTGTVAVGQSYTRTRAFELPANVGKYYVLAVADGPSSGGSSLVSSGFLAEGSETNNSAGSALVDIAPAYRAVVQTSVEVSPLGASVPLTGRASDPLNGQPAANQPVTIRVHLRGTR